MAALPVMSAGSPATASNLTSYRALAGSRPGFVSTSAALGPVASSRRLSVELWMKPNLLAAERFATAASTPGTATYRHYLSPEAYAARYGATKGAVTKVESWLRSRGFTNVTTNPGRNYVRASAAVSTIDAAFRTQLENYRPSAEVNADGYRLFANDGAVSLPKSIARLTVGVTGLDNASPVLPLLRPAAHVKPQKEALGNSAPCSRYYGQKSVSGYPKYYGMTTFPTEVCGYSGEQMRGAYEAGSKDDGTGETIALVELGLVPNMFKTLKDYAAANHVPAPSPSRFSQMSLGAGSACGNFDIEEQLDVESSYDMAPGASQVVVGGNSCNDGDFGDQGLFNADIAVLGGKGGKPLATAASNSWEVADEDQPPLASEIEHTYLVQAAAEGVGMYFSAGDGSGVLEPSADPWAIAVGGTTLGISKDNSRIFETGWSTGFLRLAKVKGHYKWIFTGEQGASGGGPAPLWKEPSYQTGVVPSALTSTGGDTGIAVRSVPDISADADPYTGFAVGFLAPNQHGKLVYQEFDVGGTSESSPLVAGMVIAAQEGQKASFGFINPAIYKLVGTNAFYDTLPIWAYHSAQDQGVFCPANTCGAPILTTFDDQNDGMFGYTGQVTLRGYDNMTGVGVPNGQAFIKAMR